MADSSRFDFCPKCGALARDGVCQSCGYQLPGVTGKAAQDQGSNFQNAGQQQNTVVQQSAVQQGQGAFTAQPQSNQVQGMPSGRPGQTGPVQGIPVPVQQPQGQGVYMGQPQNNQRQGAYTAPPQNTQGTFIQPQNGQAQGVYTGQPGQQRPMQGTPAPVQQPQGQGAYMSQPQNNQSQGAFTTPPQNTQGIYTQPQNGQAQGVYTGQPEQQRPMQGMPAPVQQPQGVYTGQPQANPAQNTYAGQPQMNPAQNTYASQPQVNPAQNTYAGQPQVNPAQNTYAGQPQVNPAQNTYAGQPQVNPAQNTYAGQPQVNPASYYGQPVPNGVQGYSPNMQAVPPEIKKKGSKKTAIIISIIIGVVVLALIVLIILVAGKVFKNSAAGSGSLGSGKDKKYVEESSEEYSDPFSEPYSEESIPESESQPVSADLEYEHEIVDTTYDNLNEEGQDTSVSYYSGPYNAISDYLSYDIEFKKESCYTTTNSNIGIEIEYPQIIGGNVTNVYDINNALYYEYSYYEELLKEYAEQLTGVNDRFLCYADAYVTYMDEQIMSVVYHERVSITLDGESYDTVSLYCLNFDLENGELLDNNKILNMDEAFVQDFKEREAAENGGDALAIYTDQEIQDMLNKPENLVLFLTPMSMEVGLNLDDRVVYVMYEDYDTYLN